MAIKSQPFAFSFWAFWKYKFVDNAAALQHCNTRTPTDYSHPGCLSSERSFDFNLDCYAVRFYNDSSNVSAKSTLHCKPTQSQAAQSSSSHFPASCVIERFYLILLNFFASIALASALAFAFALFHFLLRKCTMFFGYCHR